MSKRNIKLLLTDMIEAIEKIEAYTKNLDLPAFLDDSKTLDAVVRNFEILGEAANQLPQEFRDNNETVPWHKIISVRNRVIHGYFGVDYHILWKVIQQNLEELKAEIERLLEA